MWLVARCHVMHHTERLKAGARKKIDWGNAPVGGPACILSASSFFGLQVLFP